MCTVGVVVAGHHPSLFPIASLSKYYYSGLVTSDGYGTPDYSEYCILVSIVFSNTVRAERSDRPTVRGANIARFSTLETLHFLSRRAWMP